MINPTLHVIPIIYDDLPEPDRFISLCKKIVDNINQNELFHHYGVEAIYSDTLIKYSKYLIEGIIPPSNLRYNVMDGWLTVGGKIRWRLDRLKTSKPVRSDSDLNYPNIDKDDMILAIVPLSIKTSPDIWDQEKHFGHGGEYHGSPLKVLKFPYHVSLANDQGETVDEFFKDYKPELIAYQIVEVIADEHMGISDVQMQTIKIKFGYESKDIDEGNDLFNRLRVFFYGSDICSPNLLKQSILLFDDIHFHDRPSFQIGAMGTIGKDSRIRPYLYSFAKDGVPVIVHKGVKSWPDKIYTDSVANEIEDPKFSKIFFEGFKTDENFRNLFIQPNANYKKGKGFEISEAIMKMDFGNKHYDLNNYKELTVESFNPNDPKSLEETFAHFLIDASMKLNICCVTSHENDLIPFTEYPTLEKLMALRYKRIIEKGEPPERQENAKLSYLSQKIFQQIIPTELIEKASFEQIICFRKETRDKYITFRKYLMKLNTNIESETWNDEFEKEINTILINEVIPAVDQFQNECKRIWENMFGSIAKKLIGTGSMAGLSSFLISFFTGYSWIDLFVKGCGLAAPIVLPNVIDYALEKRNLTRKNSLAYLIDLKGNLK